MFRLIPCLNVVLFIVLTPVLSMHAQSTPSRVQTVNTFTRSITVHERLNYLLFLPADYDSARSKGWPLVLFLHGAGERGANLDDVKRHGPPKLVERGADFPFILVSPQCPVGSIWEVSPLMGLLDEVIATHNVDTNRVYLTGLSMGGYGTWSLATAHPERFAAIAPICGGGQPVSIYLAAGPRQQALRNLPVWAFHGAKDPVVPPEESQRMVDAMRRVGDREVKLTIYPEAQHDSWTETYDNPEFFQWLLRHPE